MHTRRFNLSMVLAVFVVITTVSVFAQPAPKPQSDLAMVELGNGFVSSTAKVNGTTLHYVCGGKGPSIILIHGFPEDRYEFHKVMPRLAKKFTVIAVDLPGIGGSAAPPAVMMLRIWPKIRGNMHYVVDDQPVTVADLIEQQASLHSK